MYSYLTANYHSILFYTYLAFLCLELLLFDMQITNSVFLAITSDLDLHIACRLIILKKLPLNYNLFSQSTAIDILLLLAIRIVRNPLLYFPF